jgi:hypothetical protein
MLHAMWNNELEQDSVLGDLMRLLRFLRGTKEPGEINGMMPVRNIWRCQRVTQSPYDPRADKTMDKRQKDAMVHKTLHRI